MDRFGNPDNAYERYIALKAAYKRWLSMHPQTDGVSKSDAQEMIGDMPRELYVSSRTRIYEAILRIAAEEYPEVERMLLEAARVENRKHAEELK